MVECNEQTLKIRMETNELNKVYYTGNNTAILFDRLQNFPKF